MAADIKEVSIIMATYNRRHLIQKTLTSIISQTFQNWECIIIDDGSTDDTFQVVEEYRKKDNRIFFFSRTLKYSKGLPGCRNNGLDVARGRYIIFFDDDDIMHPQLLELCIDEIRRNKVNYCRFLRSTFKGNFIHEFDLTKSYNYRRLGPSDLEKIITNEIPFNSCQILWEATCFIDERFNEKLMYAEEWEYYSRILVKGFEGISINKVLLYARKHNKSNTGEFKKKFPIRTTSKINASVLIIEALGSKQLLNSNLIQFFLQLSFLYKSQIMLQKILLYSNFNVAKKSAYKFVFKYYSFLRPIFVLKGKLKR